MADQETTPDVDSGSISPAEEMRAYSDEELVSRLHEAKAELFNLRFQGATGQLDNNRRLGEVRRSIARIYTVMRQRELGIDGRGRYIS